MHQVYHSSKEEHISSGTNLNNAKIAKVETMLESQNVLQKVVSNLDNEDATARYQLEADDHRIESPVSSVNQNDRAERHMISWAQDDHDNPYNWSPSRKAYIAFAGIVAVLNSTLGSSLPSNAVSYISAYFKITDENQLILPISIYLVGYVLGPLLFGPLSEGFGRKNIMLGTFAGYTIFMIASAVAPNFAGFLVFRFFCGICASSPITVTGGIYADIYADPVTRGRAMALYMVATCFGPLAAPIVSGYLSAERGWRFSFWFAVFFAAASWPILIFLPETYGPVLLAKRARAIRSPFTSPRLLPAPLPSLSFLSRKRIPNSKFNPNAYAPFELEKKGFKQMATVTLTRPFRMVFFESIVLLTCLYIALAYAIFFMFFEAYPIIFEGQYGFSPGKSGLMFIPIGIGALLSIFVFFFYDNTHRAAQKAGKSWARKEEMRRLPLACIGGPLYVIALLWLGWSAGSPHPTTFWVPMLAGIPFGMGFVLIFMALLNYLTDAYEVFAASAQAAASASRSVFGAALPFAAKPMYHKLGIAWASSLLAFVSLAMCGIPFAFIVWGEDIREGSRFCRLLREKKEEEERLEAERRSGGRADGEAVVGNQKEEKV